MDDQLLNSHQVAERLQSSRAYAYLLMRKGILPTVRLRGLVRVRRKDLEEYIRRESLERKEALQRKRKPTRKPRHVEGDQE